MSGSAVVQFPKQPLPQVEKAPQPSAPHTRIEVDDRGKTVIHLGTSEAPKQRVRKRPSKDRFDHNLAEDMDDAALTAIAAWLFEGIEDDEANESEWTETVNRTADFLGIKLKDPVNEVSADGTICQAVATCMQEVALKLWGTAYGELLPVGGPVKVQREETPPAVIPGQAAGGIQIPGAPPAAGTPGGIAPPAPANANEPSGITAPPDGSSPAEPEQEPATPGDKARDNLADALEQDMNWYLTKGDPGYYPDFSAMLMNRDLVGLGYREQFYCPVERKPISRFRMAQDVIVSGNPAHLYSAGRFTIRKKVSQADMKLMMAKGHYRKVGLVRPTGRTTQTEIVIGQSMGINPTPTLPRDFEHEVLQSHCKLGSGTTADLFGDLEMLDADENGHVPGYPLPYKVTLDYDSRIVLEIRRDWKRGDPDYKRRRRLVKYGMIPAFGGKFRDYGLIHLVGNPTHAATMLQRSCVDAGLFANFPAWVMAQSAATKFERSTMRPGPGELITLPIPSGEDIKSRLMAWPYQPPSAQSMAMVEKFENDVKSIGGIITIPIGEGRIGNTPVGTIMAYIESVSMVPGAVHKMDHVAQAEEFENLRELLAEHPECLTRGNKSPARAWQVAEELLRPDLTPKADPNTPSQYHRLFKVQAAIQLAGLPQFNIPEPIANQRAIYRKSMEVLWGTDAQEFENPPPDPQQQPPPAPDPKVIAAMLKAQTEQQKEANKQQEIAATHAAKMQELQVTSSDKAADRLSEEKREAMKAGVEHVKTGADMVQAGVAHAHEAEQAAQDRAHEHVQGVLQKQHEQSQGALQQQHEQGMQANDQAQQALQPPAPEGELQ